MFPAAQDRQAAQPGLRPLVKPVKDADLPPDEVAKNRKAWVDEWLSAMSA